MNPEKKFILCIYFHSKSNYPFIDDSIDGETEADSSSSQQQSDWSLVWECFEKPHLLLGGGMSKNMQDMVKGAVSEMRRYYSRKVIDVLIKVTRQSLDAIRKRFSTCGMFYSKYE